MNLPKGSLLFLVGMVCIATSLGISLSILNEWVLRVPTNIIVTTGSVANAVMWFSVVSVVIGIIGGVLVGKYADEFKLFVKRH